MKKVLVLASLILLAHGYACAGPGYYLVSTYEDEGRSAIDFKLWNVKMPGAPALRSPEIGFSYGVTRRWYTELYATYMRTDAAGMELRDISTQNDFLLTHGQYPVDLALHTNLSRFHDTDRGYAFEFGPVLQTELGRTQFNGNLFFERSYRVEQANRMQMKYQWQIKYRWLPKLGFGLQGFGELGDWDDWAGRDQQSHRVGPAISGTWPLGNSRALQYEAAYLAGSIFAKHAHVFTMRVQYGF